MSRGKHGARAANRRAELEAAANVSGLEKKVADLSAENARLKERLTEKDRAHSAQTKHLKQQIIDGASPALGVAEEEARNLREQVKALQAREEARTQQVSRAVTHLGAHFVNEHGFTTTEATEAAVVILGAVGERDEAFLDGVILTLDVAKSKSTTCDSITAVQRARGVRR